MLIPTHALLYYMSVNKRLLQSNNHLLLKCLKTNQAHTFILFDLQKEKKNPWMRELLSKLQTIKSECSHITGTVRNKSMPPLSLLIHLWFLGCCLTNYAKVPPLLAGRDHLQHLLIKLNI